MGINIGSNMMGVNMGNNMISINMGNSSRYVTDLLMSVVDFWQLLLASFYLPRIRVWYIGVNVQGPVAGRPKASGYIYIYIYIYIMCVLFYFVYDFTYNLVYPTFILIFFCICSNPKTRTLKLCERAFQFSACELRSETISCIFG